MVLREETHVRVTFDGPLQGDWSNLIRRSLLGLGWDGYMDDLGIQKMCLHGLDWIGMIFFLVV